MAHFATPRRRLVSSLVAGAVLLGGLGGIATQTATAPAAVAQAEGQVNPFSSTGGYTVYARQDATLGNDELEGSLAVGGTLTVTDAATYAILHVVAGTGDYTLPTVDGDPTRLLLGRYADSSANVGSINITNAGREQNPPPGSPESRGTLKLVDRDIDPFTTSARGSDWVRVSMPNSAPPLIDATAQTYPADAAPPDGSNVSIFTEQTGADTGQVVADYVRASEDASIADTTQCLADLTDPNGQNAWHVGVAEDIGDRKVLEPLAADRPNIVAYEDVAGAGLLQFSTETRPGASNPLIITVPEGTSNVQGLRIDPAGAYARFIMWDLSAVTGAVTVANEGGRIDGSVYAPLADVTVNAAPLEGQVFGNTVHLLGGEVHSYLFSSSLTCGEERGTFQVSKELAGISVDDLPDGMTFPLQWTATLPDSTTQTGTVQVPADGTAAGPIALDRTWATFPAGTVVRFDEPAPGAVPGWEWTGSEVSPNPITIAADDTPVIDVTVTNTAERRGGTFEVSKTVTEGTDVPSAIPAGTVISVAWSADRPDDGSPDSGVLDLVAADDGSFSPAGPVDDDGTPVQFPVGTEVHLSEPELPTPPEGYQWGEASWSPSATFTIEHSQQQVGVDLLNLLVPTAAETAFTAVKVLDAESGDVPPFLLEYTFDPPGSTSRTTAQVQIGVDDPVRVTSTPAGDPIPPGSTVWVREVEPPPGEQVWHDPELTVDGESLAGPDADGFFELPLVDGRTTELTVTNVGRLPHGSFTLAKTLDGVDSAAIPEDLPFTITWTATYPDGSILSGSTVLNADGTPVSPTDADGEPLTFPQGTTVVFEETHLPDLPGWTWGRPTFEPESLTIVGDETVDVTVTNTAEVTEGTFEVRKALSGISPDSLLIDSVQVDWMATLPDGSSADGTLQVPVDGTAASPGRQFPAGTMIALSERSLPAEALPPSYEWADATWDEGASVLIGADTETVDRTVTNTAVPGTKITLEKVVDDATGGDLPADLRFPVEYRVTNGGGVTQAQISPGKPLVLDRVPVGAVIEVRELNPPDVPGVTWGAATWSSGGEEISPGADGWVAVQADSTDPVQLTLTNTASGLPEASFTVAKRLAGIGWDDIPEGTMFPVEWTAQLPDGTARSGVLQVPATGEAVGPTDDSGAAMTFPEGTQIGYQESPPAVDGIDWTGATFAPASVTIADDGTTAAVTLTNTGHTTTPEAPEGTGPDAGPQLPGTGFGDSGLLLIAAGLLVAGLLVRRMATLGASGLGQRSGR